MAVATGLLAAPATVFPAVARRLCLWHQGKSPARSRPRPCPRVRTELADFETRRRTMVDTQVRPSDVTKFPIIDAMLWVPRERFVPAGRREMAYVGEHVPLGGGRVLLDPRTFAKMADLAEIGAGQVVLDLACGLGYSTAVLARMADTVVGVEPDAAMAAQAEPLLAELGIDNALVVAGPLTAGSPKAGPYDVVMIEGAVEQLPAGLLTQVKDGGRIICIWAEGALGVARVGTCHAGRVSWRFGFNAAAPVLPGFAREDSFAL
jgi:protein-L-isoaspartate(D-aspartate) O-methyltransferase